MEGINMPGINGKGLSGNGRMTGELRGVCKQTETGNTDQPQSATVYCVPSKGRGLGRCKSGAGKGQCRNGNR